MYKIVAIDLDGTLLNSFGEITPNTKEVLKKAIEKGVLVVLASGRPVSAIENIANEIGAEEYLISGNGALVYDIKEKKIVYDKFLSKDQVLEIVDICEENSIQIAMIILEHADFIQSCKNAQYTDVAECMKMMPTTTKIIEEITKEIGEQISSITHLIVDS